MSESGLNQRERAKLVYMKSKGKKSLQIIAQEIGVSLNTLKSWKRRDGWDETTNRNTGATERATAPVSAPNGKRKQGAQPGNKNRFLTGEYEKILLSSLSDDERKLLQSIPECNYDLMRADLAVLCVREKRMMDRIAKLQEDAQNGLYFDSVVWTEATKTGKEFGKTSTSATSVTPVVDRIGSIEDALTRIRKEKQRLIEAIHQFEVQDEELSMKRDRHQREYGKNDDDDGSFSIIYDYGDVNA